MTVYWRASDDPNGTSLRAETYELNKSAFIQKTCHDLLRDHDQMRKHDCLCLSPLNYEDRAAVTRRAWTRFHDRLRSIGATGTCVASIACSCSAEIFVMAPSAVRWNGIR